MNNIICFYHEYKDYGCFSNWYPAEFTYAGRLYSSVEQYMMFQKVILFREYELADKIMNSSNPSEIKKLGRSNIQDFDSILWDRVSYTIVKRGVRAKFQQNSELLSILLGTGDCLLAEAAPLDRKWGIGIDISDERCYDTKEWNGRNLLGRILMEVRDELRIASSMKHLEYRDAKDLNFDVWDMKAGVLERIPKFHNAIHAYSDTLIGAHVRNCFYNDVTLAGWEISMRTDMGGGLPAIGFWEMKQEIYELSL